MVLLLYIVIIAISQDGLEPATEMLVAESIPPYAELRSKLSWLSLSRQRHQTNGAMEA
jgi:hypothetical protein